MSDKQPPVRVLYSFPHKLGADRICYTAWQQVNGLAAAGADVRVFAGAVCRPLPEGVRSQPTLARGRFRIPYRLLGTMRSLALHDYIVARRLERLVGRVDVVHVWPDAALRTLKAAAKLGIPTLLERPNAHTRYAYESVQRESERIGVQLPSDNEYAFKVDVLRREEEEYQLADYILCPSDFTMKTFMERGFAPDKLLKHQYGYDETRYFAENHPRDDSRRGLTMFFCGDAAVRKGVHFALEAWLASPAHKDGTFLIAGRFLPAYAEKLKPMLRHPSVQVLGHRDDVAELMRRSDILVLPSIEEGFGLVCAEAIGSGCVPLVSEACTDICRHMENSLVHPIGATDVLSRHITLLHEDRGLLRRLRAGCLDVRARYTWRMAGVRLVEIYRDVTSLGVPVAV